jgi:hypothetical protein
MGANESAPVQVVAHTASAEDVDLAELRALRPYKALVQTPPALPFIKPPRPQLRQVSLDPKAVVGLLDELQAPLRRSEAVVRENQRVLQHNICSVEALALRVAYGTRKQRKGLEECRAHCDELPELENVLAEARARLASVLESTERLRNLLPQEVRPQAFDPDATPVFSPAGARFTDGTLGSPHGKMLALPGILQALNLSSETSASADVLSDSLDDRGSAHAPG